MSFGGPQPGTLNHVNVFLQRVCRCVLKVSKAKKHDDKPYADDMCTGMEVRPDTANIKQYYIHLFSVAFACFSVRLSAEIKSNC